MVSMMESSPLDALVFDYVGFGIFTVVNNLWTWVAVVTAAVSFWRFRSAGAGSFIKPVQSACIEEKNNGLQSQAILESKTTTTTATSVPESSTAAEPPAAAPQSAPESVASESAAFSSSAALVFEYNGLTKGKFAVYYEDDGETNSTGEDCGCDGEVETEVEDWCAGWDGVLMMRMGEMSWYRYQDLAAINGNVVRLWDGVKRREKRSSSSSTFGCGVVVW